jgi:hypothetical protein
MDSWHNMSCIELVDFGASWIGIAQDGFRCDLRFGLLWRQMYPIIMNAYCSVHSALSFLPRCQHFLMPCPYL